MQNVKYLKKSSGKKMKISSKAIFSLGAMVLCAVSLGCKSTNIQLQEYSPVAIMTVYSNPGIPWYEELVSDEFKVEKEDEGILTGFVNRALDKSNPEVLTAQDRINDAAHIIEKILKENGISVVSPNNFPNAKAYEKAGKNFLDTMGNTLPASGYDTLGSASKSLIRKTCEQTGAKSALYVHFKFQKIKHKTGLRDDGVQAKVIMEVYGANNLGKTIINKTYTVFSADWVPLDANKWDRDKLCSYFYDTIESAVNKFAMDFAYGDFSDESSGTGESENDYGEEETLVLTRSAKDSVPLENAGSENTNSNNELNEKIENAKKLLNEGKTVQEVSEELTLPIELVLYLKSQN